MLLARVTPWNTAFAEVLTDAIVAVTGWALAMVVIPESSQPLTTYLAKAEVLLVKVGRQSQLTDRR